MNIIFLPSAVHDVEEISKYYLRIESRLHTRFVDSLDKSIKRIFDLPNIHPMVHKEIRRCLLRHFPYGVYFTIDEKLGQIKILAVVHERRNPNVWKRRIT